MPDCCRVERCLPVMNVATAGLILQLSSNSHDPATWFLTLKQAWGRLCCSRGGRTPSPLPKKQRLDKYSQQERWIVFNFHITSKLALLILAYLKKTEIHTHFTSKFCWAVKNIVFFMHTTTNIYWSYRNGLQSDDAWINSQRKKWRSKYKKKKNLFILGEYWAFRKNWMSGVLLLSTQKNSNKLPVIEKTNITGLASTECPKLSSRKALNPCTRPVLH